MKVKPFIFNNKRVLLASLWLVVTMALAGWWMVFGLHQLKTLLELDPANTAHLTRQHHMLVWEGSFLLLLLLLGGVCLIYLIRLEQARLETIQKFLATFSHELKTSIASLRLQAESLDEDLGESTNPLLQRLVRDTVRLELQLENSLFLAQEDQPHWFFEKVSSEQLFANLKYQWSNIKFQISGRAVFDTDARAMESVLKNLIQNALVHGRAHTVNIEIRPSHREKKILLHITDDGKGFSGDWEQLGQIFGRQSAGSGSGIGLYIVKTLAQKMNGSFRLLPADRGFACQLELPGEMA